MHVPRGTITLCVMNEIRISLKLTAAEADRFECYRTAHRELKPSDAQLALALISKGLLAWECEFATDRAPTQTTKTKHPKTT